ncbi:MAG TPA: hypothetical protein DCS55_00420 [Acidimicrobiaceae bacterium]|nr:hypothetical protein [Acidimicrobiaceae bacterium]
MSVDERLRGWKPTAPDVDADALLTRVHRTVRRRRQRRFLMGSVAAIALFAGALLALLNDNDDTMIDTIGPGLSAPVRYLPDNVPDGFELAWVDDRQDPVAPPPEAAPWETGVGSAYVYGYRNDTVELDVDVFPGYTLDPGDVARRWEADGETQVMVDEPGRGAVLMESNGLQHAAVQIDGAVLRIVSHGLGDAESTMPFGLLHSFAQGFRAVDEQAWQAAIDTADVAPPFGERGTGDVLSSGEGWELVRVPYRQPRSTTEDALVLRVGDSSAPEMYFADQPALGPDNVEFETFDAGDRTIVWGVAPPEAAFIRLWYLDGTIEASTVPFGNNTAFALDVGSSSNLRELAVWDAAGQRIYTLLNPDTVIECVDDGDRTVTVPDVTGTELRAAIAAVEDAGLNVRGTGTAPADPVEGATITVQEPPAGTAVSPGACIGFRTE